MAAEAPAAVLLGGDLFPQRAAEDAERFVAEVLAQGLGRVRALLGARYPRVFLILGNDDARCAERLVRRAGRHGRLWEYAHGRRIRWHGVDVYGYACVPPTPFTLKDWERYDVSRFVDVGCVAPEEGQRTTAVADGEVRHRTIAADLERMTVGRSLAAAVMLFHAPPYGTALDRAALDGRQVDHAPVDVHVGSLAIRRFIESRQPRVTLHGHVHESARLTGAWRARLGRTVALSAAHDGPELALVRFDLGDPGAASRELVSPGGGHGHDAAEPTGTRDAEDRDRACPSGSFR